METPGLASLECAGQLSFGRAKQSVSWGKRPKGILEEAAAHCVLWPPWAVGADTEEPPVLPRCSHPGARHPRNGELAGIQALRGGRWASTWPGLRKELVDPGRVLAHLPPAPPRTKLRATWQGKLLHRAGGEGALRAGGHARCLPHCWVRRRLPPERGVTRRGGQWLELGARETPANAASAVLCTRFVTLDRALSYCFIFFFSPDIFFCYENLYLWKIWKINTVNPYHFFSSFYASNRFLLPYFIG